MHPLIPVREKSTEIHHEVVERILKHSKRMGMEPILRKEVDLEDSDLAQDIEMVVSVGGDSTYLQSAGIIVNSRIPLLGVNSDPSRRTGFLTNIAIE
jgi:NAD kinase